MDGLCIVEEPQIPDCVFSNIQVFYRLGAMLCLQRKVAKVLNSKVSIIWTYDLVRIVHSDLVQGFAIYFSYCLVCFHVSLIFTVCTFSFLRAHCGSEEMVPSKHVFAVSQGRFLTQEHSFA